MTINRDRQILLIRDKHLVTAKTHTIVRILVSQFVCIFQYNVLLSFFIPKERLRNVISFKSMVTDTVRQVYISGDE